MARLTTVPRKNSRKGKVKSTHSGQSLRADQSSRLTSCNVTPRSPALVASSTPFDRSVTSIARGRRLLRHFGFLMIPY